MIKVTVSIETDDQYTQVTRQGDLAMEWLLLQCISRVADTFGSDPLETVVSVADQALRARSRD